MIHIGYQLKLNLKVITKKAAGEINSTSINIFDQYTLRIKLYSSNSLNVMLFVFFRKFSFFSKNKMFRKKKEITENFRKKTKKNENHPKKAKKKQRPLHLEN